MKINHKRLAYGFILLLSVGLYMLVPSFRSFGSEILLLFTSNSTETIAGYIKTAGKLKVIASLALMSLQGILFPFGYEPFLFANIKVFGSVLGLVLSLLGRFLGAFIAFDMDKTFFASLFAKGFKRLSMGEEQLIYLRNNPFLAQLIRIIPWNFGAMSYLAGMLQINVRKYLVHSLVWILLTTVPYVIKGGYFTYQTELWVTILRYGLAILCLVILVKRTKSTSS